MAPLQKLTGGCDGDDGGTVRSEMWDAPHVEPVCPVLSAYTDATDDAYVLRC